MARLLPSPPGRAVGLVVLLFIVNGLANAVFTPFAPAILVERGVSPTWLGMMGAMVSVAYIGLASAWGHLADVLLGRGRALALAIGLAAGLLAAFALPLPLVGVGLTYMAFSTVYGLLFPLQDALAVNTLADPGRQYGQVRALQSGAFAVGSLLAGAFFERLGYGAAVPTFIVLAVPVVAVALVIPDVGRAKLSDRGRGGAMREALAIQPRLPRVLLAIGLANVGVFAMLTFLPLLIDRLGGKSGDIGLAVGITAAIEVAALPAVSRLLVRFGPRAVVTVGIALLAVVFAGFALAPSPEVVIAVAVLYGVAWSAMWAGSVTTISQLLPAALQGSGQGLLSLTTAGIASFVANVGGGLLWGGFGPMTLFGLAAGLAAVGAATAWWSLAPSGPRLGVAGAPAA
ncbi:MAG: MFS transporter [Candidatus Limnocylindrales bacterium]